jgi:predicted double-glycine peptidase
MQELSGAGGNWRVIDEIVDANVVQQQDNLSCGPACGEMLLRNRGFDDEEKILIRDPWAGTKYKMDIEEFLNYWTLFAVYRAG